MDSTYDWFNAAEAAMAESRIKIRDLRRQLAAANERAEMLEETMERLIVWANDSVDMKYGTLSADMVRKMCEKALEVPDAS